LSRLAGGAAILAALLAGSPASAKTLHTRTVVATAYNLVPGQTDQTPLIGAWGDRLDQLPQGVRAIAVSPDLLDRGLKRGMLVRIRGLKGQFIVLDKMPKRWKRRIDISMGKDVRAARRWGRRWVEVYWED
jgi:3D (Asp-Asp-Asp) domain-containing protein